MKNKKLKQIQRKQKKTELSFPKELIKEDFFKCPIWFADQPNFVDKLNKASDKYIETSSTIKFIKHPRNFLGDAICLGV